MKFEIAYYEDANGKIQRIYAKDLEKSSVFELASSQILHDGTGELRLWPRKHGSETGKPHFHSREGESTVRKVFKYENDDLHNKTVSELQTKLEARPQWTISIKKYGATSPEKSFDLLKYSWRDEVHRIVSPQAFVRHDIFGQAPDPGMSVRRPWIAIEVVNTHFPEEEAFEAFLDLSKRFPFIVIFELTAKRNYFSRINTSTGLIEPIFYIYDGSVWKNEKRRKDIASSASLIQAIKAML